MLQPNSIHQITVDIDTSVKGPVRVIYTLPHLRYQGMVHIKEGVIGPDQKAQVWVANQASHKITINKGLTIGQVLIDPELREQIEDIQIVRRMIAEDVRGSDNNLSTDIQSKTTTLTVDPQIKQKIEAMDLSTDTNLDRNQQEQLRKLLLKYINVLLVIHKTQLSLMKYNT